MINQTRLLLEAAATMKAPREARLNGRLLLLGDRATSRECWFLPHGAGELAMMCLALFIGTPVFSARAARLGEVRTVDDEIVMVRWLDSEVEWKDTGTGPNAFRGLEGSAGEVIHLFPPPLDTAAAVTVDNYSISSTSDTHYAMPTKPLAAYRKTKVSGTDRAWPNCNCTFEHTIFLKLPNKLQQGGKYTLSIAPSVNSDKTTQAFTFDVYSSVSEAIHVNLIGYNPDHTAIKSADLYMWLGDGGGRDYSSYIGRKVWLCKVGRDSRQEVGTVAFWKKSGGDLGGHNLTRADVYTCDFSSFTGAGTYRLAVEGVGCSPDFTLSKSVYYGPFKTSLRGFFYMRIGEDKNMKPVPRQPRFIPGKDPADFKVYLTTYGPFHPDWKRRGGDQWDRRDWSQYNEPGSPTNPNAWGGHADACDWDRNPCHIAIIWDLLLPYLLSNGKPSDDNCQIRESGNGIPDLIDEALYETDFWLRLRDGKGGYSCGLNNPGEKDTVMYQAAASPYMAWASAANAAMTADCFRVARRPALEKKYREAAIEAWKIANEEGLDLTLGIGNGRMRGRDLKFMAAAFLYNVTGDRTYEDAMVKECAVAGPTSEIDSGRYNQSWGVAAYLMCARDKVQPIHYPKLAEDMKAAIINEAMNKNVANTAQRPSRRSSNNAYGWFQTTQEVQAACIAHAISADAAEKEALLRALILEADYGLGRNPMNMVQMTGLGSRCVQQMFTTGRNDGVPGVHPGHTPYMNAQAWGVGYMADPQYYASRGYPAWKEWPHGEALWNAPYCYANNEFTPQQTMRGKMCLLAYLYSLGQTESNGKSRNDAAPKPSAPAIVSREGGYASRWTSLALGDTNITVQLARELETAGPSAALFAKPYYVCLRNFYVAPPPGGNDANDGASPQSPWATLTKANVGRVAGDCVNLAPGTYKLTGEVTITSGGNASTPAGYVVYRSTRMGAAHLVAAARFNHMIRITTHHVMFDGIDFDGNNFMAGLCGLDVERSPDYHHVWVTNSQVHGFGQSGIQENGSEWFWNLHNHVYSNACTVRIDWQGSGISHVVPAAVPKYTPSAMDNYWAPFHIVSAYNLVHDNYGQQGLYAGKNTDGNGIIYDTFRLYAGQSLCLGNITYHNGGKGIHVFKSGHVTVANNTACNNNWDTYNPGTWRAEISAVDSVGSTFINNIAWTTRGPGVSSANAPFMAHAGSSNTWANNIAYGAPNDFAGSNAYPSPANKANVNPLLVDVAKSNFALKPGSPAIGFGTLLPGMPPQCIDVGACPSTCTTCP